MEIESFKIKFIHIAGKDNVLADTLSRLIDIDPDVELQPELKDYKFGHGMPLKHYQRQEVKWSMRFSHH